MSSETAITIPQNFCDINFVDNLKKYVVPELPEVSGPLLDRVIRDKVIHFCNETEFWVFQLQPISVSTSVVDYFMLTELGDDVQVNKITSVELEGTRLEPGRDYILNNKTTIRLTAEPTADVVSALKIRVSLRPARDKNMIDERIFDDYYDAWRYGVISDLCKMKNQTWSSASQAEDYNRLYWDGITRAKADLNNLGVSANAQVNLGNFTLNNRSYDGRTKGGQSSFS